MQKIITSQQAKLADEYTIKHLSISSTALMERASQGFCNIFMKDIADKNVRIAIFCGTGNNGGDGWAIARILYDHDYLNITVYDIAFSIKRSADNVKNKQAIGSRMIEVIELKNAILPENCNPEIIIDAILGSGLNQPLKGEYEKLVKKINTICKSIYAVDIPTGFFGNGEIPDNYNGIKATKTITFQIPKLNFFFPESAVAMQDFEVVDIGLIQEFINDLPSRFFLVEKKDIVIKTRKKFTHKGNYGHLLVVAGTKNTMGAALLNCMGALYCGVGLVSAAIPEHGLNALNTSVPEVMYVSRKNIFIKEKFQKYNVVAIGSGLGVNEESKELLQKTLSQKIATVIDADALHIVAQNILLLNELPENTILTPHVKEFDRLFGHHDHWYDRLLTASKVATEKKIIIVLKNQYTFICDVNGKIYINSTGNPAMAQAGMGDVLTGIIASLIAQGYSSLEACITGCYLHGAAGDSIAKKCYIASASKVAKQLPEEMKKIIQ